VVEQLASVGVTLHADGRVTGDARGHLTCSATRCPDAILTLAALACVLPEPSVFTEVGILRLKESDRVEALISMVHAAGGSTSLEGERLTVTPPRTPTPMKLSTRDDHRVAMSAATLAVLLGVSCELNEADCVKKSFPLFWDELAKTGVELRQ
jgi:3-phosphoshikimate 1-carboxyvinyltransferase